MQRIGGEGHGLPRLLLLHATGFLGAMYQPLAGALMSEYEVYTLDFPGHGTCATDLPEVSSLAAAQYIVDMVGAHGLRGCLALGHSAGGAFSLLASTLSPGLFSAIYCFEAVACTPITHNLMLRGKQSGTLRTAGQLLSEMARRRRHRFSSQQDALERLMQKPPYAAMQLESVQLFVQHGTKRVHKATSHAAQQQQQDQEVQLVCEPKIEAAYYEALDPPLAIVCRLITCPVMLAVSGSGSGGAYKQHNAVQQWLLQNPPAAGPTGNDVSSRGAGHSSRSAGQDPVHGVLAVLNEELAASIPAEFETIPGVSHFGPLENPALVAESCRHFFQRSMQLPAASQHPHTASLQPKL